MKKFKDFIVSEEVDLTAGVESGKVDVHDHAVRNNINAFLNGEVGCNVVTPYVALNKVNKVLANFHIFLPKAPYMEDDQGVHVFRLHQFGKVAGMRNDGSVVTKVENPYSLYFEWKRNERGMFDIFAEIVTDEELKDLIDAVEDDVSDDELNEETILETSKKKAGEYLKKAIGIDPSHEGPSLANLKQARRTSPKDRQHTLLGYQYTSGGPSNKDLERGMKNRTAGIKLASKKLGDKSIPSMAKSYVKTSDTANKLEPNLKIGSKAEKVNIQRFKKAASLGKSIDKTIKKLTKEETDKKKV